MAFSVLSFLEVICHSCSGICSTSSYVLPDKTNVFSTGSSTVLWIYCYTVKRCFKGCDCRSTAVCVLRTGSFVDSFINGMSLGSQVLLT